MSDNGLVLSLKEFKKLPNCDKFACLYENQVKTLSAIKGYKFHQKVQYILITLLTIGAGIIIEALLR